MGGLAIGMVAARAGVKVDTVRYYERRGVLPAAERRSSGYRSFRPEAVERILFVKELQALGFTLDEIVELLAVVDAGEATCDAGRPHVEASLRRIDDKIASLTAVRDRLGAILRGCESGTCRRLEDVSPRVRSTKLQQR